MSNTVKNGVKFTQREKQVLLDCRLIDEQGKLIEVNLERPEDKPPGLGPKMELAAIQRLILADTTPDQCWLEWIFFQAGGGQRAKDAATRALEQTKEHFIDERVNGFENADTKERFKPVSKEEAEARWMAVESRWQQILVSADQDVVDHLGVFGYHRSWPGKDKVYSRVENAVTKFLRLREKVATMNTERIASGAEPLKVLPENFPVLDDLEKANSKVERYFARKEARDDIRIERIYEDDYVRVIAPLTYAASVRYGFDNWSFSNRAAFDEVLDTEHSFRDAWKATTRQSVLVFFYWKVPMPSWISRKDSNFQRYELVNLALEISTGTAVNAIHDEENAANLVYDQVCTVIRDEPKRPADPSDEEMPVKRGPNAYATEKDVLDRLNAWQSSFEAVKQWIVHFDTKRIKSDVFDLEEVLGRPLNNVADDDAQPGGYR